MRLVNSTIGTVAWALLLFGVSGCKSSGSRDSTAQTAPAAGTAASDAWEPHAPAGAPAAAGYDPAAWQSANRAPIGPSAQTASYSPPPAQQIGVPASAAYPRTATDDDGGSRGAGPSDAGTSGSRASKSGGCPSCASGQCRM